MDKLLDLLAKYYSQKEFRIFQNNFALNFYESLGNSYSNGDGEVKIVTDLCNVINGKTFERLNFYSKKIHGSRSFVEFFNKDKPTTKELADMVIISIATLNREIVYEKTAFIQNKKEDSENVWKIDQDQLYLLHNFPTFKGNKGIFKRNFNEDIAFINYSKTLGNYGFFKSSGEMLLVNALNVFKLQQDSKISIDKIKEYPTHEYIRPFLNHGGVCLNAYEFIRNWTQFNIGEIVRSEDTILDDDLSKFNRILLNKVGLSDYINLNQEDQEFNFNLSIIVNHINLDKID